MRSLLAVLLFNVLGANWTDPGRGSGGIFARRYAIQALSGWFLAGNVADQTSNFDFAALCFAPATTMEDAYCLWMHCEPPGRHLAGDAQPQWHWQVSGAFRKSVKTLSDDRCGSNAQLAHAGGEF